MSKPKQSLAFLLSGSLAFATVHGSNAAAANQPAPQSTVPATQQSPETLDQLVAPIALYPDPLVAQILAASVYPSEIVEADRWVKQHSSLKGEQLAQAVNQQTWEPGVKALVPFPSVLADLDTNLAWISALGVAYAQQPQAVMDAIQDMRKRAQQAGNLKSTSQETVSSSGQTIVIQPADPAVVYVPEYDPWLAYGAPLPVYPGWVAFPGLYSYGPGIAFGVGIGIGLLGGFGWGWHHWGADWGGHAVLYNHRAYAFANRSVAYRNDFSRGHAGFAHVGGFHSAVHAAGFHAGGFHGAAMHGGGFHARAGGFHGGGFHGGFAGFHGGGFHGGFGGFHSAGFHGGFGGFHGGGFHGGFGGFHGGGFHGGGHR